MDHDELEALWRDDRNWRGRIYFCRTDPRIMVPKRTRMFGWTINLGHPWAIPAVVLEVALLAGPLLLLQYFKVETPYMLLAVAGVVLLTFAMFRFLSTRTR